jgi:CubicO group peptidase (beta-lactamase class C family)
MLFVHRSLTIIALTVALGCSSPPAVEIAAEDPLESRVDRYLEPYLETGNFAGALLIAREGEVLLSKAYGQASAEDGSPNTHQSAFHLASVSRIFTPAAILLLEQQGKLSMDDPLAKYLPEWPRGDEITIHHLMTLSAGFPDINSLPGYETWQMSPQTLEALVEKFRDLPLEFEPGQESVHSNSNYVVLALLIEQLSGRDFGDFLKEEIFAPLGMNRTGHHGRAHEVIPYLTSGHTPSGLADLAPALAIDWSVKAGHGSLYSTVEDLYKFDRALVDHRILNEASVAKTFSEHFPHNGYGWFIRERFGTTEIHINGRSPGFGTYWGRSVGNDVTVIVLGNIYNGTPTTIGRDLIAMVLGEEYDPATFRSQRPDPGLLAEIAGSYQFGPEFYAPNALISLRVEDGHLFNDTAWLMPTDGEGFIHRIYGSDLSFIRDESGAVTGLQYDDFVGRRVP